MRFVYSPQFTATAWSIGEWTALPFPVSTGGKQPSRRGKKDFIFLRGTLRCITGMGINDSHIIPTQE